MEKSLRNCRQLGNSLLAHKSYGSTSKTRWLIVQEGPVTDCGRWAVGRVDAVAGAQGAMRLGPQGLCCPPAPRSCHKSQWPSRPQSRSGEAELGQSPKDVSAASSGLQVRTGCGQLGDPLQGRGARLASDRDGALRGHVCADLRRSSRN